MKIFVIKHSLLFSWVSLRILSITFKVENQGGNQFHTANFILLTSFIINAFSASHLSCEWVLSKMKKWKKRVSWQQFFMSVFILCLKYLMTQMITKRSKVYVACLYPLLYINKVQKYNCLYVKTKKGGGCLHHSALY